MGSRHVDDTSDSRRERTDLSEFLRSIELFAALSNESIALLSSVVEVVHVTGGDVVMRQHDPADCLFVVRVGRLSVSVTRGDGSVALVGHIGSGEVVGEMALIGDEPRSATVTADRDSELLRVSTAAFDELVAAHPMMLRRIASEVVKRIRDAHMQIRPATPCSTVTVLTTGEHPDAADVGATLIAAIDRRASDSTVVTPERAASAVGDTTDRTRSDWTRAAARWVGDLERAHSLVVFDCTACPGDEWASWCARQSDLVLVVADSRSSAAVTPFEAQVIDRCVAAGTRVELVLARPAWMQDARGTAAWLDRRSVDRHHHLRHGVRADTERIARLVRDEAVTLVLSGGGARGIAQIGVVRAIEELGIPIDAVGGTSIGSLVGGAVARGWGWEQVQRNLREGVGGRRGIVDPTVPILSLASGHRVTRRLQEGADGLDIEDLLLDYFCVSTNLSRKVAKVHRSGPAWRGIRASLAIPGLFPPVPDGDDVLVDGGLLENFPVRRMREQTPGATVIGVDVGSRRDLVASGLPDTCEQTTWSAAQGLAKKAGRAESVTIAKVLARLTELGMRAPEGADLPDVVVEPEVQDIPILDFGRFDEFVDRGYRRGIEVLGEWVAERERAGATW